jgi:hypothetical protein
MRSDIASIVIQTSRVFAGSHQIVLSVIDENSFVKVKLNSQTPHSRAIRVMAALYSRGMAFGCSLIQASLRSS